MDEAENCDRVLVINRSQTIAQGTPDELRHSIPGGAVASSLEDAFFSLIDTQRRVLAEAAA